MLIWGGCLSGLSETQPLILSLLRCMEFFQKKHSFLLDLYTPRIFS
jgi:hypothetical protein